MADDIQADGYKYTDRIDYLGDMPGADREQDRILAYIIEGSVELDGTNVSLDVSGQTVPVDLTALSGVEPLEVTDDGSLVVADVTGTVPLEADDGQGTSDAIYRDGNALRTSLSGELPDSAYAEWSKTLVGANDSLTKSLTAPGADALDGRVKGGNQYDAYVRWRAETGVLIKENHIASGVSGGTWTDISGLTAISTEVEVEVVETSGSSMAVTGTLHLR